LIFDKFRGKLYTYSTKLRDTKVAPPL